MPDLSDKVSDIAPCPMCGASAKKIGPDPRGLIYCECVDCGVRGPWLYMGHGGTSEEAITAWNRRTRPPASSMEGWRLVPEEPTAEMIDGAFDTHARVGLNEVDAIYRAMLAASPIPPEVMK